MKKASSHIVLFAKDYRLMTSGWQGAPYFRRYGRGLVSKPAILLKKSWGGYRRTTQHPVGTVIWREFADAEGNKKRHLSKVFDYKSPYWRVRYADGDWEELNEREILKGRRTGYSQSGSP